MEIALTNLQFLCPRQEFRFLKDATERSVHLPSPLETPRIRVQHEMLHVHNQSKIINTQVVSKATIDRSQICNEYMP